MLFNWFIKSIVEVQSEDINTRTRALIRQIGRLRTLPRSSKQGFMVLSLNCWVANIRVDSWLRALFFLFRVAATWDLIFSWCRSPTCVPRIDPTFAPTREIFLRNSWNKVDQDQNQQVSTRRVRGRKQTNDGSSKRRLKSRNRLVHLYSSRLFSSFLPYH